MVSEKDIIVARNQIAGYIKSRRADLGLSQQGLADKSGLGYATIQRIEYGKFIPDGKSLIKICRALGIRLEFKSGESKLKIV